MSQNKFFYYFYSLFLIKLILQIKYIKKTQLTIKNKLIEKKYNDTNKWILYHLCYLTFISFIAIYLLTIKKL